MNILENLENLNVSEECFDDIMDIVEEIISEVSDKAVEGALKKASDNVEDSTMGIFFPSKKPVEQFKRLKELANKRAKKYGKAVEEVPNDWGYTYKHVKAEKKN